MVVRRWRGRDVVDQCAGTVGAIGQVGPEEDQAGARPRRVGSEARRRAPWRKLDSPDPGLAGDRALRTTGDGPHAQFPSSHRVGEDVRVSQAMIRGVGQPRNGSDHFRPSQTWTPGPPRGRTRSARGGESGRAAVVGAFAGAVPAGADTGQAVGSRHQRVLGGRATARLVAWRSSPRRTVSLVIIGASGRRR